MAAQVNVEIIAHRGASFDAPENTLGSVRLGWQQQADAIEVDIQFSRDGHIVVIHDDDTVRIGGVDRLVKDQTWSELRALDAGSWKGPAWKGERFPSLEEVIATIPPGKRLFVEIKCGPESVPVFKSICDRTVDAAAKIVPIGFSASTMALVKKALPQLEVALVAEFDRDEKSGRWLTTAADLIAAARDSGLNALDLDGAGPIDRPFADQIREAGLKLYVWTVDSPQRAQELITAGVDGITTNRPGWLREQLGH